MNGRIAREFTKDGALANKIVVWQPKHGYRYSVDSILLAWFCEAKPGGSAVDLGAGCGVIGAILLARKVVSTVVAVELQERLARSARLTASGNVLDCMYVVRADARKGCNALRHGVFDLVVSNPPYFSRNKGKAAKNLEKETARNESNLPLDDLFGAAVKLLKPGGKFCLVHRPDRLGDVFDAAMHVGMAASRLRFVHPEERRNANLFLLELVKARGGRAMCVLPQLILFEKPGKYTREALDMLKGSGL